MTNGQRARRGRRRTAFTLTEILIVIGIIVLVIALAVPALSLMRGNNSIDGAQNNLSALLGRARADALGLQKITGVLFYIDDETKGVAAIEVQETDVPAAPAASVGVFLDVVPDRDVVLLPKGVTAHVIDNSAMAPAGSANRADDAYLGYNTARFSGPAPIVSFGGVILFDANGQLVSKTYAFRGTTADGLQHTLIMNLLLRGKTTEKQTGTSLDLIPNPVVTGAATQASGFGVVLMDAEAFGGNGGLDDPQAAGAAYTAERGEEQWIDDNSTPLLVNRYNGTFVRGD